MTKLKQKQTIFLLAVLFVLVVALSACVGTVDYSITVLLPNGTAAANVTVSLTKNGKVCASAETNSNGVATLNAKADKYTVEISNLPAGQGFYAEVTTNTLGTPLTVTLEQEKIEYSVAVKLPDGQAVSQATVVWTSTDGTFTAVTDDMGVAKSMLVANTYTVTLENLPDGFYLEQAATINSNNPSVELTLATDSRLEYTVSVVTEGGLHYPNMKIAARQDGQIVATENTNSEGVAVLKLVAGTYDIDAYIPEGYFKQQSTYTMDENNRSVEILISSMVLPWEASADTKYTIGSIMHDFTVTTFDNRTVNLTELLQTKKAVVLNLWYSTCSWCAKEFPLMWQIYQEYSNDLEIVAIDPYPSDFCYKYSDPDANRAEENALISYFRSQYGIANATFAMGMDNGPIGNAACISSKFTFEGFPTTIIIDRYGAVAFLHSGAILQEATWRNIFGTYTSDDYIQDFVPGELETAEPEVKIEIPDVEMPASAELEAAINNTQSGFDFSYYPEMETSDKEYSWPWLVSSYNGDSVIVPANKNHNNSFATVHTFVTLAAGQAVAFDFFSSTEYGSDVLYVSVDGLVQFQISGLAQDWATCYAYVAEKDGTYDISLLYYKDSSFLDGDDVVYVKNMRLCSVEDIDVPTDIMRTAVSDFDGDKGYLTHVEPVLGADGFYHVNDENGPYVLMDLLHITKWNSSNALVQYIYAENENFRFIDVDGDGVDEDCTDLLNKYMSLAINSDIYGMIPVTEQSLTVFSALMDKIAMKMDHRHLNEYEWLEVCKYVSRYGTDVPMKNPILGLADDSALVAVEGENTMSLYKAILPCSGLSYSFTPTASGVYHFYSVGDSETQIFLYDNRGIEDGLLAHNGEDNLGRLPTDDNDNFHLYHYLEQDRTYFIFVAFFFPGTQGEFNFYIQNMGERYTVLENCTTGFHTTTDTTSDVLSGAIVLPQNTMVVLKRDGVFYTFNGDGSLTYNATEFSGDAENGKFYAVNSDNSLTPVLVDFTGLTHGNSNMTLEKIIKSWYLSKTEFPTYNFQPFDFSHTFQYDENGDIVYNENGVAIIIPADGQDYTARMSEIFATADEDGFVEATEELMQILTLYAQREIFGLGNDWLMFCRYQHTYCAADVQKEK